MKELEFKTYIGTKTVKAVPMTRTEAEKLLGKSITPAEPGEEGYLVEYKDGYQSWSPAKAFDEAYKVAETHVDRMYIELDELTNNIHNACKACRSIKMNDRQLMTLHQQISKMLQYAQTLHCRLIVDENQ